LYYSLYIKNKLTNLNYNKKIMKGLFKLISILGLSFFFMLNSFAIDATSNVKTTIIDENSINLSWEPVEWAYMYYVSYWKISWSAADYENVSDFVEGTWTVISWLEKGSTYYFSVTTLDEWGDESTFSEEVVIDINEWGTVEDVNTLFSLESIRMIDSTEIELTFTNNLDSTEWTEREFSIYNKSDKLDSIWVISTELVEDNNKKLILLLDTELVEWVEYEIVVIAVKNKLKQNIKSWIDSIDTFIYNGEVKPDPIELKAALPVNSWPSWADIEWEKKIKPTVATVAVEPKVLPKTGSEHILILILSIILASLVFIFKFKKA